MALSSAAALYIVVFTFTCFTFPARGLFLPEEGSLLVTSQKGCTGAASSSDPDSGVFVVGADPSTTNTGSTAGKMAQVQLPPVDPAAKSWPDLVGFPAADVKAALLAAIPDLRVQMITRGQPVTMDYSLSRVRLVVDEVGPNAEVVDVPRRG